VLGGAEELVSNAYSLDCSMHPSSQEKLDLFLSTESLAFN